MSLSIFGPQTHQALYWAQNNLSELSYVPHDDVTMAGQNSNPPKQAVIAGRQSIQTALTPKKALLSFAGKITFLTAEDI